MTRTAKKFRRTGALSAVLVGFVPLATCIAFCPEQPVNNFRYLCVPLRGKTTVHDTWYVLNRETA